MAAPDTTRALLGSGRLVVNATNLALVYPFGGVDLGSVTSVVIRTPRLHRIVVEEETNSPVGVLWLGGSLIMGVRVQAWTADAVTRLFRGGSSDAAGPILDWPAATVGEIPAALTNVLFVPTIATNPHAILWDAHPIPDRDIDITRLQNLRFLDLRVALVATRGANGRLARMAELASIVL